MMLLANTIVAEQCHGRFINPITDLCWRCLFPISIGQSQVVKGEVPDTQNVTGPVCSCSDPFPRVGLKVGFWEPVRMVDVTRTPFCFVGLGGKQFHVKTLVKQSSPDTDVHGQATAHYHVHWYISPMIYILNVILDFACLEAGGLDIAYISELDPTWQDDELAFILNPEAAFFANHLAQAACAADCVAASTQLPLDTLFWCAGCQGSLYPFTGRIQNHIGGIQSSLLLTERLTYKLHRMGLLWGSIGEQALCGKYPMPIMKKSQYRSQLLYPKADNQGGKCCHPYGKNTAIWGAGKSFPVKGEDFSYLIWRKRHCCAF